MLAHLRSVLVNLHVDSAMLIQPINLHVGPSQMCSCNVHFDSAMLNQHVNLLVGLCQMYSSKCPYHHDLIHQWQFNQ